MTLLSLIRSCLIFHFFTAVAILLKPTNQPLIPVIKTLTKFNIFYFIYSMKKINKCENVLV